MREPTSNETTTPFSLFTNCFPQETLSQKKKLAMFTGSSHRCTCPKFKAKRRSFSFGLDALCSFSCLLFFGRNFAPMANHHGIRHPKIIGQRSSSKSPSCKYKFLAQAVEIPRHQHIHPTSTFQFPCQLRSKILLPRVRKVAGH